MTKLKSQKMCEFFPFVHLLGKLGCESYLEIGSRHGDSLLAIGSFMKKAVAVDYPNGRWGVRRSDDTLRKRARKLNEIGCETHLLFGRSQSEEMVTAAKKLGPFDAIFIDGDHTYDAVRNDWELYSPMATKCVAFHDIIGKPPVQVPALWNELKQKHRTIEFVEDWGPGPMGIGVVLLSQ